MVLGTQELYQRYWQSEKISVLSPVWPKCLVRDSVSPSKVWVVLLGAFFQSVSGMKSSLKAP